MSIKIFLSYAIEDSAFVELVKTKIKEWLPQYKVESVEFSDARSEVEAGDDIRQSIKSAIEKSNSVVVISSESSNLSPWVNYEVGLADALGKELLIVEQEGASDSAMRRRFIDTARIIKVKAG